MLYLTCWLAPCPIVDVLWSYICVDVGGGSDLKVIVGIGGNGKEVAVKWITKWQGWTNLAAGDQENANLQFVSFASRTLLTYSQTNGYPLLLYIGERGGDM